MNLETDKILSQLKNPDAGMRTAPLWVWNDRMTDKQIENTLDELKSHGFGGAVIHPRPGMILTYLSEEWFEQWGYALKEAKKRDMKLYIYDENSYPSGFGGGHVSAELPDCLATSVSYKLLHKSELQFSDKKEKWFGGCEPIRVFTCEKNSETDLRILENITEIKPQKWSEMAEWFIIMEFQPPKTEGWLAGFANVDLLRRDVTELFIQKVYEPYYQHFGADFGDAIPAIFTDEPAITGSMIYGAGGGTVLPYSRWFSYEFYKRNGYFIEDYLPALFVDAKADWFEYSDKKVRYDYYDTTRELWVENFIKPLSNWCEGHRIALTGHFMEDDWPRAGAQTTSPDIMGNFEYMGWPAIDMLVNDKLLNSVNEPVNIIMHELRSAVNQFGQKRCFCEAFGAGGWDSTLIDFKRIGDWLMMYGVNFINEHLTYTSYTGARKRDHPQSFDWREPWWDEFTDLNHYWGRACMLLSRGKMQQRILMLHPTSTGYMRVQDDEASNLVVEGVMAEHPDMKGYLDTLQLLTDEQWDFDLGNENMLRNHGCIFERKLQVKHQKYEIILVTEEMQNMFSSTAILLQDYLEQGGTVISLGNPGNYVDGVEKEEVYALLSENPHWITVSSPVEMSREIAHRLSGKVIGKAPFVSGVEHMMRELGDDKRIYFVLNHSMQKYSNEITIEGEQLQVLNLWSGEAQAYPYIQDQGKVTFSIDLERWESAYFLVGNEMETVSAYQKPHISQHLPQLMEPERIEPETFNSLPLEYCNLELDGKYYEDMCCIFAGKEIFKHRGFSNNPWDNEVQFKDRYLAADCFGANSGFTAVYPFFVEDIPSIAEVVVEQGQSYEVYVNGNPVKWKEGYFLDKKNTIADIAGYLKKGRNEVKLINKVFHIQLELEPIYIRGEFGVADVSGKWTIVKQQKIQLGDWTRQGYPFYEGAFLYQFSFHKTDEKELLLQIPHMETTSASLSVNGKRKGIIGINGNYLFDITEECQAGTNEVTLRVCGGLKNLLGPHHCEEKPRRTAWPDMWRQSPKYGKPKASAYDFIAYGLAEKVLLFTL